MLTIDAGAGDDRLGFVNGFGRIAVTLGAGADQLRVANATQSDPVGTIDVADFEGGDRLYLGPIYETALLVQAGSDAVLRVDSDGAGPAGYVGSVILRGVLVNRIQFDDAGGYYFALANITGTGGDETLTGTNDADTIEGLGGNDSLYGLGGGDTLNGGGGNDYVDGGAGADVMAGGSGDDVFVVDDLGDQVLESEDDGFDIVYTSVSYTLTAGSYAEILSAGDRFGVTSLALTGNELSNSISGNAGNNAINGGGGNDFLYGFEGGDAILGGDGIDTLDGGDGNDNLNGGAGADVLIGGAGNDFLDGGAGADIMAGGSGDDVFVITDTTDEVRELVNDGFDIVYTPVDYTLTAGSHVEIFAAGDRFGTAPLALTGNELSNSISGNAGNNAINGGGGNDFLYGFEGGDAILGGDGIDTLDGGDGNDNLNGGAGADVLIGGAGNDFLDGAAGADVMAGGGGDDAFVIDEAGDEVRELVNDGFDIVYTPVDYTLTAGSHVEILAAGNRNATTALNLTGNELGNTLWGNAGANILNGGGGNDALLGYEGTDTISGGDGNDTLDGGDGGDILNGGDGNDSLSGGTGNDTLIGGTGSDRFVFRAALVAGNADHIADLGAGDVIVLGGDPGEPFAALASGSLASTAFTVGPEAFSAEHRIIYNFVEGTLSYDSDGVGGSAAVVFARVTQGTAVSNLSFVISGPPNNVPTITSGTTAAIAENNAIGAVVYQTAATDADGDRITYRLNGADQALFTIDANGAVRATTSFNFEVRSTYNFTVEAYDSSGNGSLRNVTLSVTDVDEGAGSTPVVQETASNNNSTSTAQVINRATLDVGNNPNLFNDDLPSVTIRGSITPTTDSDFYAITLQAGERLILDVENTPGDLDIVVRIYNSAGQQIGYVDDAGVDPGSTANYGDQTYDSFLTFRAPDSGTYFFSIESYGPPETWNPEEDPPGQGQTGGTYEVNVSVGPPATAAELFQEDIEALISGSEWTDPNPGQPGTNLTYAFPNAVSDYPNSPASDTDGFQPFSAQQQTATTQLLQLIANVSSVTFANVTGTAGESSASLRFAENGQDGAAYAYYPGGSVGGTAWFNTDDFNNPVRGGYAWMGILHEAGHAMGLKHGHEFPAISFNRDSLEYSVMTYRAYPGDTIGGGYGNETWGFAQTLMMLDIAALQQMYGANYSYNSGNTTYSWNASTGEMSINGTGQGAPGGNRVFMTVWDGGGTDTYDLSNYTSAVTIDLRPGEWTTTSQVQLANLGSGRSARGNVANALLFDNDPRSLIENAIGGSGNDVLIANQALNQLTGNGGFDRFAWRSASDSGVGAQADRILDFTRGFESIDLAGIDAISGTTANDSFTFIGTGAFTNTAGQLRYQVEGGNARVQADLNGDGVSDFEVLVTLTGSAPVALVAMDFVL